MEGQENGAIGREGERKKENKWDIRVDQDPTMEKRRYRWWMLERKRTKRKKEK